MKITIIQQKIEGNKPHFKGFVKIGEVEYTLAAWPAKSGKTGVYTGSLEPKGDQPPEVTAAPQPEPINLDDGIPF